VRPPADGDVDIAWSRTTDGRLSLRWTESGGPIITPPTHRGFGTRIMENIIGDQLRGEVHFDWRTPRACLRNCAAPCISRMARDRLICRSIRKRLASTSRLSPDAPRRVNQLRGRRCRLLTISGHHSRAEPCLLSGAKRTSRLHAG
jgi:hypothetical protein